MGIKRKIYLRILVFGGIFCFLLFFWIIPQIKELKTLSVHLNLQRKTIKIIQKQIENAKNFQENYFSYQPIFEKIRQSFVDPETPIDFIKFLEKESQQFNLLLKISPFPLTKTNSSESLNFQIMAGGKFPNCLKFLARIEKGPYLIEILKANIKRIGERKQGISKEFQILQPGEIILSLHIKAFAKKTNEKKK